MPVTKMYCTTSINPKIHSCRAFSLVELSIVLLILVLMFGWIVMPQLSQLNQHKHQTTQQQLEQLRQTLIDFFAVHGRFPCPASAQSSGTESLQNNNCLLQHGFYPATTLSTLGNRNDDQLILDAWQHPIRYSITNVDSDNNLIFDWVDSTNTSLLITNLTNSANLQICQDQLCNTPLTSVNVVAVIHSQGATQNGSNIDLFNSSGFTLTGQTHTYSVTNKNQFIAYPLAIDSNNFDDLIVWITPFDIIKFLL